MAVAEETIKDQLKKSFVDLDNDISEAALNAVRKVGIGYSVDSDIMKQHILRAVTGACVNALLLHGRNVFVANTGDCRSVLGRKEGNKWVSIPLSTDHAYSNQDEVDRIAQEHPGEMYTLFTHKRLLGGLMPFRSFGDVSYKWKREHLNIIYERTRPGYYTPPYLTAEPEVSHHELAKDDKFVVIASDGLWERLSNDKVYKLLTLSPPESRNFRDDITIIIATFR